MCPGHIPLNLNKVPFKADWTLQAVFCIIYTRRGKIEIKAKYGLHFLNAASIHCPTGVNLVLYPFPLKGQNVLNQNARHVLDNQNCKRKLKGEVHKKKKKNQILI